MGLVPGFPLYVSFLDAINSRSVTNVSDESENAMSPSFTSIGFGVKFYGLMV